MVLEGSEAGNLVLTRHDVGAETAREIEALVASEPPLLRPDSKPEYLDDYVSLLSREAPVKKQYAGLSFVVPDDFRYDHDVTLVSSDTPEGDDFLAGLVADMPQALAALKFLTRADFEEPWCIALHEGEVASIAQTSRLTSTGAESGIDTVPEFRGRGFAAAAVSGWALHPALGEHALFYSTKLTNVSSQRVAQRLGLRLLGADFAIT